VRVGTAAGVLGLDLRRGGRHGGAELHLPTRSKGWTWLVTSGGGLCVGCEKGLVG
jgi:hypothetical protein